MFILLNIDEGENIQQKSLNISHPERCITIGFAEMPAFKNQMWVSPKWSPGVKAFESFCYLTLVLGWKVLFG